MKKIILLNILFGFMLTVNSQRIIWEIGQNNNNSEEFSLHPSNYENFIDYDFGWEDKFFLVGHSNPLKDWPYILPGPSDSWGGTAPNSGRRTATLNILFTVSELPSVGDWNFKIDLINANSKDLPLLKILINGHPFSFTIPAFNKSNDLDKPSNKEFIINIPLSNKLISTGGNIITLTTINGSWLQFDQLSLSGPDHVTLGKNQNVFLKSVKPADYELEKSGQKSQPLLTDIEHLSGSTNVKVVLDDSVIFTAKPESGRYIYEAPMPAVSKPMKSRYAIYANETLIETGFIERSPQPLASPATYVNTFMGTAHSRWMIAPGPWMPFSMVKLSPDNQGIGWQSGYDPTFESIGTFSHIHEWTMAGLGTFPVNGKFKRKTGPPMKPDKGYRSRINKETEEAPLGYYKAELTDYGITAELTATTRCGFQRYTFPEKSKDSRVMIDLAIPAEYPYLIKEATINKVDNQRIEGYAKQVSPYTWGFTKQEYTVHFVIEFDQPIKKFSVWKWTGRKNRESWKKGKLWDFGGMAFFDTEKNRTVQMRTAISYVSIENARQNLLEEITSSFGWDFDKVRNANLDAWNELLKRVEISTSDAREKSRFYTNFYRSLASRNIFSDVNGEWIDAEEQLQKVENPDKPALGCDAFWNSFWNLNPLWNLTTPEWSSNWVQSQLNMYQANGWLAKGPAGMEYIPVMVAEHEIPLIVGAYQMGIRDFDAELAFEAAKKMQTTPAEKIGGGLAGNQDLEHYLKYKYIPYDKGRYSNTLEYAYDDWTLSQFAKSLNKPEEYETFLQRGYYWKNAIDSVSGYARLKDSDGKWMEDFDPYKSGKNKEYVEGNAWQLTFFVPQDVPALARYIGKDKFIERLNWGFEESYKTRFNGKNDQYWNYPVVQGNQQSMHFAWLFNWVGQPWQTQKWSRAIMDRYYGHGIANAYLGDEDQGQMSAWFVLSALGLFQTDGGTSSEPVYEIGSPLFEKTVIDLGHRYGRGDKFTITARNSSRKNIYVQSASLNGNPLNDFKFPASELLKGGELVLEMGAEPNFNWGTVEIEQELELEQEGKVELEQELELEQEGKEELELEGNEEFEVIKKKAREIISTGFNAGDGYMETWIRDLNTFIELAADVRSGEEIKEALLIFFKLQGEDGNIQDGFTPIQHKSPLKSRKNCFNTEAAKEYCGHKNTVETDQETSLVQAVYKYIQETGDQDILKTTVGQYSVAQRLEIAMEYLMENKFSQEYGLLFGATTADWGDVQHTGFKGVDISEDTHFSIDIYDNAMFIIALDYLMKMIPEKQNHWKPIYDRVKTNAMEYLWDKQNQKFIPHLYLNGSPYPAGFNENEIYYPGGTAIAIEAGLLSREQVKTSYEKMKQNMEKAGAASIGLTLYPVYPDWAFKNPQMKPYGYQNGGDWTWFGARMVQQLIRYGFIEEAYEALRPMCTRVIENDGFFEWYTIQNKPKGSGTFRGSAGVLYKAILMLENQTNKNTN